jgi:hypothetical protein
MPTLITLMISGVQTDLPYWACLYWYAYLLPGGRGTNYSSGGKLYKYFIPQ